MITLNASSIEKYVTVLVYVSLLLIALTLPCIWCFPIIFLLSLHCLYLLKKTPKYTWLRWQDDHTVLLENQQRKIVQALVQEESVIYPFLIILTVRHLYTERLLLWTDSADRDLLRAFRVWLLWKMK